MTKLCFIGGVVLIAVSGACSIQIDFPNDLWCYGGWFTGWAMVFVSAYLKMLER
jgi:hypothetical protein